MTEVAAGLLHHPNSWAGRTVLVFGTVIDVRQVFPTVHDARVMLTPSLPPQRSQTTTLGERMVYALSISHGVTLVVITQPPSSSVSFLRRAPIVGRFVPPPQRGSTFGSGRYRVQLAPANWSCLLLRLAHPLPNVLRSRRWQECYDGVLMDYLP